MDLDILRLIGALFITAALLALFYIGLKLWKERPPLGGRSDKRHMQHIETLYLDSRTKVHLISIDEQTLVVSNGPQGPTLLYTSEKKKDH